MARKGMGTGRGKGYKNMLGGDRKVHSQSAKGVKQPQKISSCPIKPTNVKIFKRKTDLTSEELLSKAIRVSGTKMIVDERDLTLFDEAVRKTRATSSTITDAGRKKFDLEPMLFLKEKMSIEKNLNRVIPEIRENFQPNKIKNIQFFGYEADKRKFRVTNKENKYFDYVHLGTSIEVLESN